MNRTVLLFASIALVASAINTHAKTTQLADDAAIFTYPTNTHLPAASLQAIGNSAKTTLNADDAAIFTYPAKTASLRGGNALAQYPARPASLSAPIKPSPSTAMLDDTGCVGSWIGDGYCDSMNNNAACQDDGGDCCASTCVDADYSCGVVGYDCNQGDEANTAGSPAGSSCADNCGGYAGTCYCDDVCTQYDDCCDDYTDYCSASYDDHTSQDLSGFGSFEPWMMGGQITSSF